MPSVDILRDYFSNAETCSGAAQRLFGIEVETLFVDSSSGRPISRSVSQNMVRGLLGHDGWRAAKQSDDWVIEVSSPIGTISYDLGWNLFELSTVPALVEEAASLHSSTRSALLCLYEVAARYGACPLYSNFDGTSEDTLVLAELRDSLFRKVDGSALCSLAHIASVQFNVDLLSIEEGFKWMRQLELLFAEMQWPPRESNLVWRYHVRESPAGYEPDRFGPPASDI